MILGSYEKILGKLKLFVSKYYKTQLIKGAFLFLALGATYFLVILALEHFFWMSSSARLLLLVALCIGAFYLAYRFVMVPLFYLFRLRKGLSNRGASKLIGKHFGQVDDKLLNLLDLADSPNKSELLLASIEQKSRSLESIPFVSAINLKDNLKYVKYLGLPLLIVALIWASGGISSFFGSYERVVNYDLAYEPPAPFTFLLLNESLTVLDNQSLTIKATTQGNMRPEDMYINLNGETLLMQKRKGTFEYNFEAPVESAEFYFSSNDYDSRTYSIESLSTPALQDFIMHFKYPAYIHRKPERIMGTGNASVPEGTKVVWELSGTNIEELNWTTKDTVLSFIGDEGLFVLEKNMYRNTAYTVSSSNKNVKEFERLNYEISVVRDANPTITMEQFVDSTNINQLYFRGQIGDDYEIREFRVVVHPTENPNDKQRLLLERPNSNVAQVYYTFPSGMNLEAGQDYSIYFEVVDNDAIHGGKVTKSQTFSTHILNETELKDNELDFQESVLDKLEKSIDKQKEQQDELQKINDLQKQKTGLNFENMSQIKEFLKKQESQENLMEKFTNQLKETLKDELGDEEKKLLQERLERQEKKAKENAKLLEELNKIADKIDKEELKKKLEELGKNQSSSQRNLEQLLELTKRYYVTEKAAQLAQKLEKLAKDQEILSQLKIGQDFSDKQQRRLNDKFKEIDNELYQLKEDNSNLNKPLDLDIQKDKQEDIKKDQNDALEEINKHQGNEESSESESKEKELSQNNASNKQRSAAQKMKEIGSKLGASATAGGGSTITEDAEMLRQILDNLITFSFKQEALFENLQEAEVSISGVSGIVKAQKELRSLFEHVDDSLFALSLRRAELSDFVNEQITEVYYNIDKSLESTVENQIYQGASYQQYVLNAGNGLADFLAKLLDNMQQSMQSGQGSGQGGADFQLPDIIQGQGELQQQMGQSGESRQQGQDGEKGEQGDRGDEGEKGKTGDKGENGEKGQGSKGNKGQNGSEGEQGQNGQSGNGSGGELSESQLKEVYEIYKQQQFLRQQLEKQLADMIDANDHELTKRLLRQMEDFENELLESGITEKTINKVNQIQHQLLKLENAALQQGEKKERQSITNQEGFKGPITTKPELFDNQNQDIEILNRQTLPLRQNYQNKVKLYFKDGD